MLSFVELGTTVTLASMAAAVVSQGLRNLRHPIPVTVSSYGKEGQPLGRPEAGTWHSPRYGKRYRVGYDVEYVVRGQSFRGRLRDMSRQGWRVRGPISIAPTMTLSLLLHLPGRPAPLIIDEAQVRWVDGAEFGIELTRLCPETAGALSEHLAARFPPASETEPVTLSPCSYN